VSTLSGVLCRCGVVRGGGGRGVSGGWWGGWGGEGGGAETITNTKFCASCVLFLSSWDSAHGRFFDADVNQPIISWLCARTANETLPSHIFLTICCNQCVRYTSTRHLLCHNMFYDHTLSEIWMLPDIYKVYNYRLTRARRNVECAFGTVCNTWRIFHRATDVCPDFCDGIVKTCCILHSMLHTAQHVAYCTTCCILHNFVRQRETAFSARILYTNVPSRVLRLLAVEVLLQERIWGGGFKGRECLSVWASLGSLAGVQSTGYLCIEGSEDGHLSP